MQPISPNNDAKVLDILWKSIIGLRNVLVHDYGEILYERIWTICTNDLPELVRRLEALGVEELPGDDR